MMLADPESTARGSRHHQHKKEGLFWMHNLSPRVSGDWWLLVTFDLF
jgi:hypothetical protein